MLFAVNAARSGHFVAWPSGVPISGVEVSEALSHKVNFKQSGAEVRRAPLKWKRRVRELHSGVVAESKLLALHMALAVGRSHLQASRRR